MNDIRTTKNLFAVSANNKESAINTAQNLDTVFTLEEGNIANLQPRRETNVDEANGREEPDVIYDRGATVELPFSFPKAQPQHIAFALAYGLGLCSSQAQGNGYAHTLKPIQNPLERSREHPSFTGMQRLGDSIVKRRFLSMFVDSLSLSFVTDDFVKLSGSIKGTGKVDRSVESESITAAANATSLALAANGVQGADAAARLDSIHQITVELTPGVKTEVEYTAVSDATPAIITITAPDTETDDKTYEVLYAPTEAAWGTFPSKIMESPLQVCAMTFTMGGKWNGSTFEGGRELTSEINSVEHTLNNNLAIKFAPGGCNNFANKCERNNRQQMLKLNREMREYILQHKLESNEYFGGRILCQGAVFATGENYLLDIVYPRLGVLTAPISSNNKRLAEAGDLQVLEDLTYGSVIGTVVNQVSSYAQ